MKIAVYTAIFGDKDELKEPVNYHSSDSIDYFLITDNLNASSEIYKILIKNPKHKDVTKDSRFFKVNGLSIFRNYDYVIWHDGNIQIKDDSIFELIKFAQNNFLATFKHPERKNYYDEAIACIKLNKDNSLKIFFQSLIYFYCGLKSEKTFLYETGLLVKNMNLNNKFFYELWWLNILKYSKRDQLSLPFIAYRCDVSISIIPGSGRKNKFSNYFLHKKINKKLSLNFKTNLIIELIKFLKILARS